MVLPFLVWLWTNPNRKCNLKMSKQCDVCILWLGKGRKSNLKVKLPLQRDLHVHGATEAPYWPILAWDTRVRVKTQYFEKFKINISTGRIQTKFSTRKRLNTRSILLRLTCDKFRRVPEIFKFFSIWNIECLAKRRVNMRLFSFVWCYYGIWPPFRKVILWGFQRWFRF
jgi:hypothetical protein